MLFRSLGVGIVLAYHADGACLRSRLSASYCRVGAILMVSHVQEMILSHMITAIAWDSTHWIIYMTNKVATTAPRPAHTSWDQGGSCCQMP